MENGDREDMSRFNNGRGYHMRPPYPPPSNHFPYNHSDQRGRPRRDGPPPYSGRYHHQHNRGNGSYHNNNHERMKPPPYDVRENWRFSAPYSGESQSFSQCGTCKNKTVVTDLNLVENFLDAVWTRIFSWGLSQFLKLPGVPLFAWLLIAALFNCCIGPRYPEKGKSSCSPGPYGGPPSEPERFPNHGWSSYPPRPMGHRNHTPYRPPYEGADLNKS